MPSALGCHPCLQEKEENPRSCVFLSFRRLRINLCTEMSQYFLNHHFRAYSLALESIFEKLNFSYFKVSFLVLAWPGWGLVICWKCMYSSN